MKRLKITKLRLTPAARTRLDELGLTTADLDTVVCFNRKTESEDEQLLVFDIERVPEGARQEVGHLAGVTLVVVGGEIIDVMRDA
ncbi:MAG: hypothetical protein L0229_24740 [Blastocatellia bacterium]|nr:hypothetical protein [Blastocatellia bacterium]